MGATATAISFVSVDEYLHTSYHPDVDYVDGYIEERLVGENSHSDLQGELLVLLRTMGPTWGIYSFVEQRLQVKATRYRVPDVLVMPRTWKKVPIIRDAPLLCIEVLSPEDTFTRMQVKCRDYLNMGVPEVWVFDPEERYVLVMTPTGTAEHRTGTLRLSGTPVEVSIEAIFAVLDEGR